MSTGLKGNPSQSYGASPAIPDHTALPDTDRDESASPQTQSDRPVLDLLTPAG